MKTELNSVEDYGRMTVITIEVSLREAAIIMGQIDKFHALLSPHLNASVDDIRPDAYKLTTFLTRAIVMPYVKSVGDTAKELFGELTAEEHVQLEKDMEGGIHIVR